MIVALKATAGGEDSYKPPFILKTVIMSIEINVCLVEIHTGFLVYLSPFPLF